MPSFNKQQRFGAELRDPRLADAELVGEVLHRTLFEEVADDDALQALGQRVHGVHEVRLALAVEDRHPRASRRRSAMNDSASPSSTSES